MMKRTSENFHVSKKGNKGGKGENIKETCRQKEKFYASYYQ